MSDYKEKYTIDQVRALTWTRVLEVNALEKNYVTNEQLIDCTEDVLREVGKDSSLKDFLLARAAAVRDLVKNKGLTSFSPKSESSAIILVSSIVAIATLGLGLVTNELATNDNRINLLSPPLLGFFLWNLFVYLVLFVSFILSFAKKKDEDKKGPIRDALSSFINWIQTLGVRKKPIIAKFYQSWIPEEKNLLYYASASIFHLGAMCFGLGMIASIALRGWGTAYTVGWESMWVADSPNTVLSFLRLVYDTIPVSDNLFQNLDVEAVKNMRFDVNPAGSPAAEWVIRLIMATGLIVILPRCLLFLWNKMQAFRIQSNFPINLRLPYYQNLIYQQQGKSMNLFVIPFGKELLNEEKSAIKKLALSVLQSISNPIFDTVAHEDTPLSNLEEQGASEVWIVFSMAATPEMEVHIQFAKDVKSLCDKKGILCRILVNATAFEERFKSMPKRIEERKQSWSVFIKKTGLPYAFVNMKETDAQKVSAEFETTSKI